MLSLNCAVCGSKKIVFIKEQEAKEMLHIANKIQLLDPLLI